MSSTARRASTRQDVEKTLEKIAKAQSSYYTQWVGQWTRLIEERAENGPKRIAPTKDEQNTAQPT
jgi:hypothetical protein